MANLNICRIFLPLFILKYPKKAAYFGIKFTHGCELDTVVRLDFAGAFSENSAKMAEAFDKYGVEFLSLSTVKNENSVTTFDIGHNISLSALISKEENATIEISENRVDFTKLNTNYIAEKNR